MEQVFLDCGNKPLGLYPIVETAEWIARLAPLGVTTFQLRIKDKPQDHIEREIIKAVEFANTYQIRLFINDYWQLGIKHKAYGIHLGQEDLDSANCEAIAAAGLRLGVSTHCQEEVERALTIRPSYFAYGPVYPTTSKDMKFSPQGLERLVYWRHQIDYPLVAIGGIDVSRMSEVLACGVDGVALISAITKDDDPEAVTKQLLKEIEQYHEHQQ